MAVTPLNATAGSVSANAYATLVEADQYHEDRPAVGTTWAGATNDQKTAAILFATKLLDRLWRWNGYTTTSEQALMWPRGGLMKPNQWESLPDDTIPAEIRDACAEYARQLLAGDIAGNSDIETQGITAITAGPVSLEFKENVSAKPIPDTVVYLIPREWGYSTSRGGQRSSLRT